jgi:hypothetical protein
MTTDQEKLQVAKNIANGLFAVTEVLQELVLESGQYKKIGDEEKSSIEIAIRYMKKERDTFRKKNKTGMIFCVGDKDAIEILRKLLEED